MQAVAPVVGFLAVFLSSFVVVTAAGAPADPIEGKWLGQVGFPQDRVDIGLEIHRDPPKSKVSVGGTDFEQHGKVRADAAIDGPRVIFGSFDGNVYALDRSTGRALPVAAHTSCVTCRV